jgi:hypothetical protein
MCYRCWGESEPVADKGGVSRSITHARQSEYLGPWSTGTDQWLQCDQFAMASKRIRAMSSGRSSAEK